MITMNNSYASSWRDISHRTVLANNALEARFQSGLLYQLKDISSGKLLISIDPQKLPSQLLIFDLTPTDLDSCSVKTKTTDNSLAAVYKLPDGNELQLRWRIGRGKGDLVLQLSSRTAKPAEHIRYTLFGCDITDKGLVWINAYGAGQMMHAPWSGVQIGDTQHDGLPNAYPNPLVALFQGEKSGWFLEGRDPRTGPANMLIKGNGSTVDIGMVRRFPIPIKDPALFEVRIRTYKDHWESAVDPYINWLEKGAGFIPIGKLPKEQAWVQKIKTQAYIAVGNYATLEDLAKRVDPTKTFVGRQAEHRAYSFDVGYPDYRLTEAAKKWVKRVRELGFHVGVHFNSNGVGTEFPELVEKFKPGFQVTSKDEKGNDTYESIYNGRMIRCSPAYKPWRDYLIAQMKDAVDTGVDVIYLDESMTAVGKYIIDGVDGMQGMYSLMKETLQAYPHVAVETEQFNLLTARYGKFALSQMPFGHPLSGYIFQRYVKVVPEGIMYSPIDSSLMDAFDCYGFMLPGADPMREESWVQIAQAFHKYDLVPDAHLPRKQITQFTSHWTGGMTAVDDEIIPAAGEKLFGLRGSKGVTAYYEKYPNKRGLVVYEPGKVPKWIGTRYFGIKSLKAPGVPAYFGYRQFMKDWLIYDDTTILGLNPGTTYMFDESVQRSQTRFHVTNVPDDFIGYDNMERRIAPYEVGTNDSFFRIVFSGHGKMTVYVPDEYDVYLDGNKLDVDRKTKLATATINATAPKTGDLGYFIALTPEGKPREDVNLDRPSMLLAYKRTDNLLQGNWVNLPWQGSKDNAKYAATGADSFTMNIGAFAIFIGKLPQARSIHLEGSYIVNTTTGAPGDGVVLINGKQVMRVPAGDYPYKSHTFSQDISSYAGQYVLIEVIADGPVRGATANWNQPKIVVGE